MGEMKTIVLEPQTELIPYIEKYVDFNNENLRKDAYHQIICKGKLELFICFDDIYVSVNNGARESILSNFFVGISKLNNSLKIKPLSERDCFKGISITFSTEGVHRLLGLQLKSFANSVVCMDTILGKIGKQLVESILKSTCLKERGNILNQFFIMLLDKKKISITTIQKFPIR